MRFLRPLLLCVLLAACWCSDAAHHRPHKSLHWVVSANTVKRKWDAADAIRSGRYKPSDGGLNDADRALIGKYYSAADSIFEFGVGESTQIASYVNVSRFTGVDSSVEYISMVAKTAPKHFRFHFADVGRTGHWGYPVGREGRPKYPFYSIGALASEGKPFDFYMVDGRFRASCVFAILLHASRHAAETGAQANYLVGVHDFSRRYRHQYKKILEVAEWVDGFNPANMTASNDTVQLFVFRRRAGIDDERIMKLWHFANTEVY